MSKLTLPAVSRSRLYVSLGVKGSKLPAELNGEFSGITLVDCRGSPLECGPVTVHVRPSASAVDYDDTDAETALNIRYRPATGHRIAVACPHCTRTVPFGRFHMHYQTKVCMRRKVVTEANPLESDFEVRYLAGRIPGGYMAISLHPYGFDAVPYTWKGKPQKTPYRANWSECERFSMLATQPSAFSDWIGEGEGVPDRFNNDMARERFTAFGGSCRFIEWEEYSALTEFYTLKRNKSETERTGTEPLEERRSRLATQRKENREYLAELSVRLRERFPELMEH